MIQTAGKENLPLMQRIRNTVKISDIVDRARQQGETINDDDLAHISPLRFRPNFNNIVCIEIAEPYDEDTLGGYLGISGGFGGGFIMGLKVHFADFGEVTGLGLDTGQLKVPIYILSLGGAFGD